MIQDTALDNIRELLATHWREAKDAADDDGQFAIGLRITVQDGAPAKLKVKCSISKTVTDEIDHLFHWLLRNGMANFKNPQRFDSIMRLALRAQSQSARTLETISALKNPAIFAKQLNVAQQQVVSNGNTGLGALPDAAPPATPSKRGLNAPHPEIVRLARNPNQKPKVNAVE